MSDPTTAETVNYTEFSFQEWREDFIRIVLIGASILGGAALAVNFLSRNAPVYLAIYTALFIALLVITFIRLPYWLRAGIFLSLICLLAISSLAQTGIWGGARMYFLTLVVMSGLLYSPRASINATVISIILVIIAGWFTLTGQLRPTDSNVTPGNINNWAINAVAMIMSEVVVTTGLYLFQRQFNEAQARAVRVMGSLATERANLETRVVERTQAVEERNAQMRTMVYFVRQISEIKDAPALLAETVKLITQSFGHYHAAIFLLDEQMKYAFLQAASSDEGRKMLERGYRVEVGDRTAIGQVAEQGRRSSLAGNIFDTAQDPELPRTRSRLVLPLLLSGKVTGVLDIQSERPQAFGQNEAEVFQLLADQIVASLSNVRLLSESQALVSQLEAVTASQTRSIWREKLREQKIAYQFAPTTGIKSIPPGPRLKDDTELSVPLVLRGQQIGSIGLKRKDETRWADADRELAEKVAAQVVLALENSRLLEETRLRAMQEQTVSEISARFSRSLDVDALLQTAARELGALPEVAEVSVFIGPENDKEVQAAGQGQRTQ